MRTFLLFASVLTTILVGCGGAGEAAAGDEASGTSNARLSCSELDPEEDVCSFGFDPKAARAVVDVTSFAKAARQMRTDVESGCNGALAILGRAAPADGRACEAVGLAIGGAVARLEIHIEEPRCEAVGRPACAASSSSTPTICHGGSVTAVAPDDATPFEVLVASLLSKRYGAILRAHRQTKPTVDMAGAFSGSISAVSSLPEGCASRVSAMVGDAQPGSPEGRARDRGRPRDHRPGAH